MEQISPLIIYLPCIGAVLCILGFIICYVITISNKHIPDWFIFPAISFLGFKNPEHYFYAVFFTTGAVCFFVSFLFIRRFSFKTHGIEYDKYSASWLRAASIMTLLCPFLLTIQATIPLQLNILDENMKLTVASIVHQGSAVILFILSLIHAVIVCFFIKHTPTNTFTKSSVVMKNSGLIGMMIALVLSIVFHPASNFFKTNSHIVFNIAGLAQWIFVVAMMVFYVSYTVDFKKKKNCDTSSDILM